MKRHKMSDTAKKIMKRMSEQKTGGVGTPKDFADLGVSAEIYQALHSLVKTGRLRRVDRGLYDVPKLSGIMNKCRKCFSETCQISGG